MIEQLFLQTRFKHPYKPPSDSLATHPPYNPRRRLKTPEASERPSVIYAGGDAGREFHLPVRQAWDITAASQRTEMRERIDAKATPAAAGAAP